MLPPELERDIFEYAAYTYPESVTAIVLVARRCQIWIERIIYETIVLYRTRWTVPRLIYTINSRPAEFFATTVKSIHILPTYPHDDSDIARILSPCTGITQLIDHSYARLPFPIISRLNLKELCIAIDNITDAPRDGPFSLSSFQNLTHLTVYAHISRWAKIDFSQLPALTYLALQNQYSRDVCQEGVVAIERTLEDCPSLQALVVYVQNDPWASNTNQPAIIDDPRLLILPKINFLVSYVCLESWFSVTEKVMEHKKNWITELHPQHALL